MRLKQQLTLIILITILTLTGPVQAVTASQLADHDDSNTTTKMRLPNEGRSDLQELIQRVDANVGEPSSEEPSSDPEVDEPETIEEPVEDSGVSEAESKEAETTDDQKVVVQAKAPRAITTHKNGTSTWTFDSDTGLLVFGAGTLAESVNTNLTRFEIDSTTVVSIQFESGVVAPTNEYALFGYLTGLSQLIDINNFDTLSVTHMVRWFYGTSALATPDLSTFNTSNVTNMSEMFLYSGVTSLNLSSWDVTKVTTFSAMFQGADQLTTLNLSNWGVGRTATTVSMDNMFLASALTNLNLTNFKTTNVTNMSVMFARTKLTSLDLSDWDVTKVTTFSAMFQGADQLTTLNLSNWGVGRTAETVSMNSMFRESRDFNNFNLTNFKTTNVTNMGGMFYDSEVTSLDLSDWDVTKVTTFGTMFQSANELTTLNLSSWGIGRTATTVDMSYMFYGTSVLTNLNLMNFKTTNVTTMYYMFAITGLTSLDLSDWDVTKVVSFERMFYYADELSILNLSSWGVGRTAETVDMDSMFYRTLALTNLNLINFKTTNVTDMYYMFAYSGLTGLDLSDWDVTKVTKFRSMFMNNSGKLTTLNLSNWGIDRTATDVDMYYMFYGASALTNLNLTNFKTTNVINMQYMFYGTGLTSLDLSGWDVTQVTSFSSMFSVSSSKLRTLNLSGWNTSGATVTTMFSNATNLWKITLGENIKFNANPSFTAAPAIGTTIPGTSYKTTAKSWQIVGTGTEFNPQGAMVTTTEMYADRTEPVTYVWANKAEPSTPTIDSVSNITFGTLGASDFFNGNSPLATNMATGSVALKDLDNSTTYNVTVAQTSDWTTDGESATIAKSNLKIKYGANDLATGACSFWSGTSATATKSIAFNHDDTKNFSIWLNPSAVLDTTLLGKQLESELTWTLSETP